MREAGDIEQDANLVLGIWNDQAGEVDWLLVKEAELKEKLKIKALCIDEITQSTKAYIDKDKVGKALEKIETALNKAKKNETGQTIRIKVLKNRNGQNNGLFKLKGYLDRYFIDDIPKDESLIDRKLRELEN